MRFASTLAVLPDVMVSRRTQGLLLSERGIQDWPWGLGHDSLRLEVWGHTWGGRGRAGHAGGAHAAVFTPALLQVRNNLSAEPWPSCTPSMQD